jgi:hypothetical protein
MLGRGKLEKAIKHCPHCKAGMPDYAGLCVECERWSNQTVQSDDYYAIEREISAMAHNTHERRDVIFRLAQNNPIVANAVQSWRHSSLSWEDALTYAVQSLVQHNDKLMEIATKNLPSSFSVEVNDYVEQFMRRVSGEGQDVHTGSFNAGTVEELHSVAEVAERARQEERELCAKLVEADRFAILEEYRGVPLSLINSAHNSLACAIRNRK